MRSYRVSVTWLDCKNGQGPTGSRRERASAVRVAVYRAVCAVEDEVRRLRLGPIRHLALSVREER